MAPPKTTDATVGDLLQALERVEMWIRDIRRALGKLDAKEPIQLAAMKGKGGTPPTAAGQCPPPPAQFKKRKPPKK